MQHPDYPKHTFVLFSPEDTMQVEALLASIKHDTTTGETNSYLYLLNDQSDPALRDILEASEELVTNSERCTFLEEVLKRYNGKTKHLPTNIKRTAKNVLKTLTLNREKEKMKQSELQDLVGEDNKVLRIVGDVLITQNTQKDKIHSRYSEQDAERIKRVCEVFGQFLEISKDENQYRYRGRFAKLVRNQYGGNYIDNNARGIEGYLNERAGYTLTNFLTCLLQLENSTTPEAQGVLKRYSTFEHWNEDVTSVQIESWKTIAHPTLRAEMETIIQDIITLQKTRDIKLKEYDTPDLDREKFEQQLRDQGLIDENLRFIEPKGTLAEVRGAYEMWNQYSQIRDKVSTYGINSLNEHIQKKTVYANKLKAYSDLVEDGYDGIIKVINSSSRDKEMRITDYHSFSEKDQKLLIAGRHRFDIVEYITKQPPQKKAS